LVVFLRQLEAQALRACQEAGHFASGHGAVAAQTLATDEEDVL